MDDIAKEIAKALAEYTNDVEEGLEEAQKAVARETVRQLRKTSPKLTGDYARGWSQKKKRTGGRVVYNRTDYQLTHLLEYGHAKRGGGRVPAYPHIRPAEEKAIREYTQKAEEVIKG